VLDEVQQWKRQMSGARWSTAAATTGEWC